MGRKSNAKQHKKRSKAKKADRHLDEKRIIQEQKQNRKIDLFRQYFSRSSRVNQAFAEQLECEAVPSIMLADEFNSSVYLLKKVNLNKFKLEEIVEVLNRVHGSGLMKGIAVKNNMSLYEYCAILLSSWLDKVPDRVIIPDNQMLHIIVDCNTFEVLPILILSKSKLKELLPEFSGDIKAGANVMMELAYTEEDAMLFAMHLNLPDNIINESSSKYKLFDEKDGLEVKALDLKSCYYTTPSDVRNISLTIGEWQKEIKLNEKTMYANYSKVFYSKYAKNYSIHQKQLSLEIYTNLIHAIYQDFNEYLSQTFRPDLRCLKGKDGTIYCVVAVRKKIFSHPYLSQLNREIPWLEYIFVDPKYLNQGIGKLTFQYLIAEFGNEIASQIYFYSTSFFEKQGFELILHTQLDADFYIAKNLHSSFKTYEVQVLIPESDFCDEVIRIACSLNQGLKFTLYNIMMEHVKCSSVQLEDLESNKFYLMEPNGTFEIFSMEMEGDEFPLIFKDDFNRTDFFMDDTDIDI